MTKKPIQKIRCELSKEGMSQFGKQRRGYIIGEAYDGTCFRVLWDGLKSMQVFEKSFINANPLIELFVDDDGLEREKPLTGEDIQAVVTPMVILSIEEALSKIREKGISQRGLEVLVKDFCGTKVGMNEIREVINSLNKIKAFYFPNKS